MPHSRSFKSAFLPILMVGLNFKYSWPCLLGYMHCCHVIGWINVCVMINSMGVLNKVAGECISHWKYIFQRYYFYCNLLVISPNVNILMVTIFRYFINLQRCFEYFKYYTSKKIRCLFRFCFKQKHGSSKWWTYTQYHDFTVTSWYVVFLESPAQLHLSDKMIPVYYTEL